MKTRFFFFLDKLYNNYMVNDGRADPGQTEQLLSHIGHQESFHAILNKPLSDLFPSDVDVHLLFDSFIPIFLIFLKTE